MRKEYRLMLAISGMAPTYYADYRSLTRALAVAAHKSKHELQVYRAVVVRRSDPDMTTTIVNGNKVSSKSHRTSVRLTEAIVAKIYKRGCVHFHTKERLRKWIKRKPASSYGLWENSWVSRSSAEEELQAFIGRRVAA